MKKGRCILLFLIIIQFFVISCKDSKKIEVVEEKESVSTLSEEVNKGKTLFLENCASCHNNDMVSDMTGPALYGVEERWETHSDLIHFIQDAQEMINSNHLRAKKIAEVWPSEMTTFSDLDSLSVEAILDYIKSREN